MPGKSHQQLLSTDPQLPFGAMKHAADQFVRVRAWQEHAQSTSISSSSGAMPNSLSCWSTVTLWFGACARARL